MNRQEGCPFLGCLRQLSQFAYLAGLALSKNYVYNVKPNSSQQISEKSPHCWLIHTQNHGNLPDKDEESSRTSFFSSG